MRASQEMAAEIKRANKEFAHHSPEQEVLWVAHEERLEEPARQRR